MIGDDRQFVTESVDWAMVITQACSCHVLLYFTTVKWKFSEEINVVFLIFA